MKSVAPFLKLARPHQWIKNILVAAPILFAMKVSDGQAWARVLVATAAFCAASSAVYVGNDVIDRHSDRLHPRKRHRPLAQGLISPASAWAFAAVLALGSLAAAFALSPLTAALIAAYLVLQAAYTLQLKQKMLLDVMCIAAGFVLRAVTGAVAIRVEPSPWLIICTFTLCLFLGFCKRRMELATLGDSAGREHRATLASYNPELLTHLITLSAGVALFSFLLYASRTEQQFGTMYLVYTVPLVIYAVQRFAMLSILGRYADPTDLILRDRAFQVTAALWVAAVWVVIRWGPALRSWVLSHAT